MSTIPLEAQTAQIGCCNDQLTPQLDHDQAKRISEGLQLLAHPIRLQILDMLSQSSDVCVCDLEAALPVKQPTVSHHLKLLREAGLIDCERRGLWAYYFVQHAALARLRAQVNACLASLGARE